MNKVVYNDCFGGFGLSKAAIGWLEFYSEDKTLKEYIKEELDKLKSEGRELKDDDYGFIYCPYPGESEICTRHHPDLIRCIETIGPEKASGNYANLKIKEISGCSYRIDEYDGKETVIEPDLENYIIIK